MIQQNTVSVRILDKDYHLSCPESERSNLESAARYLDSKMREIRFSGRVIGADRIAVMAAINIAHELLHKKHQDTESANNRAQVLNLLSKVELALASHQGEPGY